MYSDPDPQQGIRKYSCIITNENKYGKWFEAWGEPENPNKDWIPNKENFGQFKLEKL